MHLAIHLVSGVRVQWGGVLTHLPFFWSSGDLSAYPLILSDGVRKEKEKRTKREIRNYPASGKCILQSAIPTSTSTYLSPIDSFAIGVDISNSAHSYNFPRSQL